MVQNTFIRRKPREGCHSVTNGVSGVGNVISRLSIPIINAYGCESGNVHASNKWLNLKTIKSVAFELSSSKLSTSAENICEYDM